MPAEPIELRIVQSLQAGLKLIKTADGYHYTAAGSAVKLDPDHEVEKLVPGADAPFGPPRPFFVLDVSASPSFEYVERTNRVTIEMPFIVHAVHDSDPTDDDGKARTYLRLFADIEKALAANQQHGGLAFSTLITGRTMGELDGQAVLARVSGSVRLHRGLGEPNG